MKKIYSLLMMLFIGFSSWADEIEMADVMRSNGKIYVVVAVIVIIFTGILVYLISIDRKLKKIEERQES